MNIKPVLDSKVRNRRLPAFLRKPLVAIEPSAVAPLIVRYMGEDNPEKYSPSVKATADLNAARATNRRAVVIPILDVLTQSDTSLGTTYSEIGLAVERAGGDPSVDRVILYVDSPGGEVTGLPETAALIAQVAKVKPVTAVVSGMAASAAYYLVSQATDIVLTPSGEVGSVGIRAMHFDISKALQQDGIRVTEIFSGDYKTEFSPFTPLSDDAKSHLQAQLDETYSKFLTAVKTGRGSRVTEKARASRFGNGRMLPADQALAYGMVDTIQSPRDFFKTLASPSVSAGINAASTFRARLEIARQSFQ